MHTSVSTLKFIKIHFSTVLVWCTTLFTGECWVKPCTAVLHLPEISSLLLLLHLLLLFFLGDCKQMTFYHTSTEHVAGLCLDRCLAYCPILYHPTVMYPLLSYPTVRSYTIKFYWHVPFYTILSQGAILLCASLTFLSFTIISYCHILHHPALLYYPLLCHPIRLYYPTLSYPTGLSFFLLYHPSLSYHTVLSFTVPSYVTFLSFAGPSFTPQLSAVLTTAKASGQVKSIKSLEGF